jgi:hypothetical protein
MADNETALPEGTDTVIAGASKTGGDTITADTNLVEEREIPAPNGVAERPVVGSGDPAHGLGASTDKGGTGASTGPSGVTAAVSGSSSAQAPASDGSASSDGSLADRLRSSREKLTSQAGDRARGFVGQGLERSAEALANVGRMVGDTATGIDDRLGNDYGDYARRAASAIENAANTIASKDPDELIDDARTFVRNSPGIALAGAAVVGFVVARLVKSGLATTRGEDDDGRDD